MKTLIVGCGYVGLALGAELARAGHDVFGLRRSAGPSDALEAAGITALRGDVTRPESLAPLPSAYDWVVNCASASGGGLAEYRAVYLEGTRHLLAWLAATPPKRFVYTSSSGVYGQTDGSLVDESSPTEPVADTAQVLVETEHLLLDAARRGFPAVILRVAGIYGPGRGYWLKQFQRGKARLDGDGARMLNMIHRDDVAGAIRAALERGRPGEVYNATDDEPVSQLALFQWLAGVLQRPMPPPAPPEPAPGGRRGVTSKRVSNGKLKRELAYRFKFPTFREGYAAGSEA